MNLVQADVNLIYIKNLFGHAYTSITEIYTKADGEAKQVAPEKAAAQLDLTTTTGWEQDAELTVWLSSLE